MACRGLLLLPHANMPACLGGPLLPLSYTPMHRQQASLVSLLSSPAHRANSCRWYCPLPALPCSISHPSLEQKPPSRFASAHRCACVTPTAQALPNRLAYPGRRPLSQLQPPALLPVRQPLTHPCFFVSLLTASACPPARQPASCPHYGRLASSKACLKQHSHSHITYDASPQNRHPACLPRPLPVRRSIRLPLDC